MSSNTTAVAAAPPVDPTVWKIPDGASAHWAILGISCSFLALSFIFVPLRFWARKLQKSQLWTDDWLMIPAWLSFIGLCACFISGVKIHTIGYSQAEETKYGSSLKDGAIVLIVADLLFALTLGFTKLSAIFFFKRVFCVNTGSGRSAFRMILNISAILVVVWTVAFFIIPLTFCQNHFEGNWVRPVYNKYCGVAHRYLEAGSVTDLVLEILVICLPIPKIWGLQTTLHRRLGVLLVFLTAFLSVAASLARLAIISYLVAGHTVPDPAKANSAVFFIWTLEAGAAILAVNMPSLWYLRTRKTPERVLRSLRSMISLRSTVSSKNSPTSRDTAKKSTETQHSSPTASIRKVEEGWYESDRYQAARPKNDIKVTRHVAQTVERI